MEVVDEVEDIPSGKSATLTVSLAPGNYVPLCNIVEEKEKESHYQMGMSTEFVLEEAQALLHVGHEMSYPGATRAGILGRLSST